MGHTGHRLSKGLERSAISNVADPSSTALAQSEIFIVFDLLTSGAGEDICYFNHAPGGYNVLYLDGHVDFVKHPTGVPVDRRLATLLGTLVVPES